MTPRRCIVLGGSGALGRAVCGALAAEGARVGLTYFTGGAVAEGLLARLDGAVARRVDLASSIETVRGVEELADELGGVDALVHCAAIGSTRTPPRFDTLAEMESEGWDRLMAVNVKSAAFACQALVPRLEPDATTNVVLLGSVDGVKSVPAPAAYAASKGALRGMTLALAKELGEKGVLVNVIAPGVLTSGLSSTLPEAIRREYLKHCNQKRLGRHEEIARLVTWFALRNTYVTAQTIVVDGGL